jgi:sugar lactone lactonase YvrE
MNRIAQRALAALLLALPLLPLGTAALVLAGPGPLEAPAPPAALRTVSVLDREVLERAGIRSPGRLAYGADGALHVLDEMSGRVVALDPQGRERFSAGGYGSGDASASLASDIALDRHGLLLVLDRGRGSVLAYDAAGRFLTARELGGDALDEARAAGARLLCDPFGNLWLLSPVSRDLIPLDDRLRPSRLARFLEPGDSLRSATLAAFLPSGRAWIYDADAGRLHRFAGDGRHESGIGAADGGRIAATDIATDSSGNLFVADREGQRLLVFDREGRPALERILGGPTATWRPTALAAGPGGRLAVADAARDEIQVLEIVREEKP